MIAIIMSAYNGEKYINEQIESILNQSMKDFKLYIFDDGSKDRTGEIVAEYVKKYPDKVYFKENAVNLGAAASFLNGVKEVYRSFSEAEYFFFADQDDIWKRDKLEIFVSEAKAYKEEFPLAIFSDVSLADKDLKVTSDSYFKAERVKPYKTGINSLLMENKLIGMAMMVNRELVGLEIEAEKKAGRIPKVKMHDWWFALIAAVTGKIIYINKSTAFYRQHGKNTVGGESFTSYLKGRIFKFNEIRKRLCENFNQAEEFAEFFKDIISDEKLSTIRKFASLKRSGFMKKRVSIIKNGFTKSGVIRNIALMIFV